MSFTFFLSSIHFKLIEFVDMGVGKLTKENVLPTLQLSSNPPPRSLD